MSIEEYVPKSSPTFPLKDPDGEAPRQKRALFDPQQQDTFGQGQKPLRADAEEGDATALEALFKRDDKKDSKGNEHVPAGSHKHRDLRGKKTKEELEKEHRAADEKKPHEVEEPHGEKAKPHETADLEGRPHEGHGAAKTPEAHAKTSGAHAKLPEAHLEAKTPKPEIKSEGEMHVGRAGIAAGVGLVGLGAAAGAAYGYYSKELVKPGSGTLEGAASGAAGGAWATVKEIGKALIPFRASYLDWQAGHYMSAIAWGVVDAASLVTLAVPVVGVALRGVVVARAGMAAVEVARGVAIADRAVQAVSVAKNVAQASRAMNVAGKVATTGFRLGLAKGAYDVGDFFVENPVGKTIWRMSQTKEGWKNAGTLANLPMKQLAAKLGLRGSMSIQDYAMAKHALMEMGQQASRTYAELKVPEAKSTDGPSVKASDLASAPKPALEQVAEEDSARSTASGGKGRDSRGLNAKADVAEQAETEEASNGRAMRGRDGRPYKAQRGNVKQLTREHANDNLRDAALKERAEATVGSTLVDQAKHGKGFKGTTPSLGLGLQGGPSGMPS